MCRLASVLRALKIFIDFNQLSNAECTCVLKMFFKYYLNFK